MPDAAGAHRELLPADQRAVLKLGDAMLETAALDASITERQAELRLSR